MSTPVDDVMKDYCETNLDDIVHLKGTVSFDRTTLHQSRSSGYIRKKGRRRLKRDRHRARSCCLSMLFRSTSKSMKDKKELTFTQHILAPIVTLKDLISTSFSISSSSSCANETNPLPAPERISHELPVNTTRISMTPPSSCKSLTFDPPLSVSTPKSSLVHSYTSLSNYRLRSMFTRRQYSLEEHSHQEECVYCSSGSALSVRIDSNNNQCDRVSMHSVALLHAVEAYLSCNNSLNETFDLSSISSEQYTVMSETKPLSLCEINEIIFAIHSTSDDTDERHETLDALASSLREVAEETPFDLRDEDQAMATMNAANSPVVAPGLGQIVARAVMYEIVMRLFSFYVLIFLCYARLL